MGFTTGYELRPGDKIYLANRTMDEERVSEGTCAAQVVWCQPATDISAFSYRVGVRFDENNRRGACGHWQDGRNDCRLP